MSRLLFFLKILWIAAKGGEVEMAVIYAKLIIENYQGFTFKDVPKYFKPKTKAVLEALGAGELAVEGE